MPALRTGRQQRATTAIAKARTPNLTEWYSRTLPAQQPGEYEFLLDLLRPRMPAFPLGSMVDQLTWDDQQTMLTGSLAAHQPDPEVAASLPVSRGDLVRCRIRWEQTTYRLWTMRVQPTQYEVETALKTVTLQDDVALLDNSELDWFFRKSKAKPHGYTADEITIAVARRLGVGVGTLTRATQRFALAMRGVSGLSVLKRAWTNEKQATGVGYVIRLRDGKIDVVPIRRNPLIYVLADQIQTALITQQNSSRVPVTVLEGHGRLGNGKGAQKITFTEYDRAAVSQLGYMHRSKNYGRVSSPAELRAKVKRDYAAGLRVKDSITVSQQGIPFIERGDGERINLPGLGYTGAKSFVYCTRASHSVQAAQYTTQWDFTVTDPFLAELEAEAKASVARAGKRSIRRRGNLNG